MWIPKRTLFHLNGFSSQRTAMKQEHHIGSSAQQIYIQAATRRNWALIQWHQQRPTLIKPYLIYTNYDWNWLSSYLFNIQHRVYILCCISWIMDHGCMLRHRLYFAAAFDATTCAFMLTDGRLICARSSQNVFSVASSIHSHTTAFRWLPPRGTVDRRACLM